MMRPLIHSNEFQTKRGFVLLFAVSLASLLLAIALGVSNIAAREIKFGTSARDTSAAFFAADTGVECAIFNDKAAATVFPVDGQETTIRCASQNIPINYATTLNGGVYDFVISGLGESSAGCAQVTIEKDDVTVPSSIRTTIISKGYNVGDAACGGTQANRVERELEVTYYLTNPVAAEGQSGFPRVIGSAQSAQNGSESHTVNLPSSVAVGDLLIVFFSIDGIATTTWPSGWSPLFSESKGSYSYTTTFEGWYKVATTTEAGTNKTIIVSTNGSVTTAHQSLAIVDYVSLPEARTNASSFADPDPPILTPAWGPTKTLWLAAVGRGYGNTSAPPAGYSNYVARGAGSMYDSTTVETARREQEAASEDPGNFTMPFTGDAWIAATVGIQGE